MKYTNNNNTSLEVAVWLAASNYDFKPKENSISVTTLLKSVRQILLTSDPVMTKSIDISDLVASRMGTAFHDSIEDSWINNHEQSLLDLGYPKKVIESIRINPEKPDPDCINVYLEKRSEKELTGLTISGKFDIVVNGRISDFKSTSTFAFTKGKSNNKYIQQMSIYRWLNQDIITEDTAAIQFIFTDWNKNKALSDPDYPQSRVVEKTFKLISIPETESFIKTKIKELKKYDGNPEIELPLCNAEDLWMDPATYAYYAKPDAKRATKNFKEDMSAAYAYRASKGYGEVVERPSEPRACKWCSAPICTQRDGYIAKGILTL